MSKYDIFTTLTMNASGYNQGINSAKKSTDDFGKGVQTISTGIKSAFGSMLGAVGLGVGVFEGVKNTIEATQLTSDKFEKTLAEGKSAVDYFFISLSSGDFSGFLQGLRDSITEAGNLADTLDNLEDVRRGLDISKSKNQSQLTDLALVYKDKTGKYSKDERQTAFSNAKDIMTSEATDSYNTFVTEAEAILNDLAAKTGLSADKIKDIIENYKGSYDTMFSGIQEKMDKLSFGTNKSVYIRDFMKGDEQAAAQIWLNFQKASGEKLDAVATALKNQYDAENNIKNVGLELIRVYNELFKIQEEGNKKVNQDISTQLERLDEYHTEAENGLKYKAPSGIEEAPKERQYAEPVQGIDTGYINTDFVDGYTDKADDVIDKNKELEDSFNRLTEVNRVVGDSFLKIAEDGKITMAELTAAVMQSVMQIIIGKMAETSAFIASDSVKKFGWAGIALASVGIGLVSSLFSGIMSDAGNFADSGIVPGSSMFGDRMIAHVNSREMILSTGDQQSLFDMIKSGGSSGGVVEFQLRGDRLEGSVNNNIRKKRSYQGSFSNRR